MDNLNKFYGTEDQYIFIEIFIFKFNEEIEHRAFKEEIMFPQ